MFLGHHAVAFAAKRVAPRTSLGVLMGAALFLDLVWPALLLAGVETVRIEPGNTAFTPLAFDSYPFSHSLLTSLGMAAVLAALYWSVTRYVAGAWMVGLGVLSHWALDFISHRPDLPLSPGVATRVGLGLWNSVPATLLVELSLFAGGLWLYARTTRPVERKGRLVINRSASSPHPSPPFRMEERVAAGRERRRSVILRFTARTWFRGNLSLWILVGFLLVTYLGNVFGPPPPGWEAVAWVAMAVWVLPLWAAWVDRRRPVAAGQGN